MVWHAESLSNIEKSLETDISKGLSESEAKSRLSTYGQNRLKAKKKKSIVVRFFEQFKDVMVIILLIAAAISFVVAFFGKDSTEFFEPIIILGIVILNATLGVVQESKAEKALESLQKLSAPHARVIRDGVEYKIDADNVVPGDIVLLEAGDFIPADSRLIECASLKVEESALTGESIAVEKNANIVTKEIAPLGDRFNMIYTGCSVAYGRAKALVVNTGMKTEMGKIATLLDNEEDTTTPLQKKLAQLGKYLGFIALGICVIIFIIGLVEKMPALEIFMMAVSLAVAAIPEGLPAIVTIVLAMGVQKMVKRNAIIRRLPAVETLGSASVICSDKTGTLTQNRMTLVEAYMCGRAEKVTEQVSGDLKELLTNAILCCDGSVVVEEGKTKHLGDPTETSIVLAGYQNGLFKEELNNSHKRVSEVPFDSERKLMTTVNEFDGKYKVIVKGAVDMLILRCTKGDTNSFRLVAEEMASRALRVLAVATKTIDKLPEKSTSETLEFDLELVGLVGMIDPPRPEAREAVRLCREAGIKPVMITGDHVVTASAIATDLGIKLDGDDAITGMELAAMSDEELDARVREISVYARVSPEDKIRIVKAWQKQGEIVSMTGDGVNDAPALKAADIGCAMGITGTDVAKNASAMTLTDDNFATIVEAVREGRGIYDNIKKAVTFLLGTNIGEILTVLFAMLIWQVSPLLAMQLLWINLVTDTMPALALGMEPVEKDIMKRKPRPKSEGLFANGLGIQIGIQGLMFGALTLGAFAIGYGTTKDLQSAQTMAFMVLSMSQIFHAFNMRSSHSLFKVGFFSNKYMNGAAALSLLLIAAIVFIPPIRAIFGLVALDWIHYLIALGLSLVPILVLELAKLFGISRH